MSRPFARCREILNDIHTINALLPDAVDDYFVNLGVALARHPTVDGLPIICLGSGRCGSTTLIALLRHAGCAASHENPPMLERENQDDRLSFHLRRFELLTKHCISVADASPGWLQYVDPFLAKFPHGRIIALTRPVEDTVQSFARVQKSNSARVEQYVRTYHHEIKNLMERIPSKVLLVNMDDLNDHATQQRIYEFAGVSGTTEQKHHNKGAAREGRAFWF